MTREHPTTFDRSRATRALVLIRPIARELGELDHAMARLRSEARRALLDDREGEAERLQDEMQHIASQRADLVEELARAGVEPDDEGGRHVHFPALIEERAAWLCWSRGEAEVAHWHERGAPCAGRRRLD